MIRSLVETMSFSAKLQPFQRVSSMSCRSYFQLRLYQWKIRNWKYGLMKQLASLISAWPSFHRSIAPQVWSQLETIHKVWYGLRLLILILRRRSKWFSFDSISFPDLGSNLCWFECLFRESWNSIFRNKLWNQPLSVQVYVKWCQSVLWRQNQFYKCLSN